MAAPIQRYGDPRLFGTSLVKPLAKSYEWIRTVAHPLHPKCNLIVELAIRVMKVLTGILAMALTFLPALVGRLIQVLHYYALSEEERKEPLQVRVHGMQLPYLTECSVLERMKFHGTNQSAAIGILRWGFDPCKTAEGSKMGEAVYVSIEDDVAVQYGEDQLILSLDLGDDEVAYVSTEALNHFQSQIPSNLSPKEVGVAVRALYLQNGYRAIFYSLSGLGWKEAVAVYDPSCISIVKVQPSPFEPRTALEHELLVHKLCTH